MPSKSSIIPALVVPPVATTANKRSLWCTVKPSIVCCNAAPFKRSSVSTNKTSTSTTLAIAFMEECAPIDVIINPFLFLLSSFKLRQYSRAVTIADKFAAVPPLVKTPNAPCGNPVKDTIHFMASFSQKIPPAPSIQYAPWILEAEVTKSNKMDALVGAAGTNAK